MPLPLNQMTNRFWIGARRPAASAAYAVPVELNIEISGGTPTMTGSWAAVRPLRKILRDKTNALSDYLRHGQSSLSLEIPSILPEPPSIP